MQVAQPSEAAEGSDARVRPPEEGAAAVVSQLAAAPPQEAEVPAAVRRLEEAAGEAVQVVVQQPAVAAEPVRDAEVLRLAAAEVAAPLLEPWARRPAAERPALAAWAYRPGQPLPWPGQRPEVRTAHAMWRSQAALPSTLLWQAARCEGLS